MSGARRSTSTEALPTAVLGAEVAVGDVETDARVLTALTRVSGPVRVLADRTTGLVEVGGVARYLIEDGTRITVEPAPDAATTAVRTWLHGTVLAVLAAQQGRFALHASVVDLAGRRIAVAGRTGAGKSTTVVAVSAVGGRVVSDDVAVLDVAHGRVESVPYGRSVHLSRDAATRLAVDVREAPAVGPDADKVSLPAPPSASGPLDLVVVLVPGETPTPTLTRLGPAAALRAVRRHAYRHALLERLWASEAFEWQVAVARRVPVHRLVRPTAWSADGVVERLRSLVEGAD